MRFSVLVTDFEIQSRVLQTMKTFSCSLLQCLACLEENDWRECMK